MNIQTDQQSDNLTNKEAQNLIEELKVQQLKLSMQIEELTLALKESDEKFRLSFQGRRDAFYIESFDDGGVIVEVNDAFEKLFGYSREETLGKSTFELNLYDHGEDHLEMIKELRTKGSVSGVKLTGRKKNGELISLSISLSIIQNKRQKCISGVISENSEREISAQFPHINDERCRAIFENIQDVFYQTTLEGEIIELSPSIKKLSDFDREEIIGKQVQMLYHDPNEREVLLDSITGKRDLHDYELKIKTKTGQIKIVSINARLIDDPLGIPHHIDGSMRDITRRKQAEEEVKILQKAIENSNASVVITDNNGNIEYANPYYVQLTGFTKDDYMGQNPNILNSGYHSRSFYDGLWKTIKSGQTWEGEFYNRKKNGQHFWEHAIISPVQNEKNEITHYVAIKTDITAAKKINEELINAKLRAEESDKLKTAFLNNISHEIRTPFNGILGFISILQSEDLSTEERGEYTKIINESAFRLINTISDIAEASALQTGTITILESEFSLIRLTDELIQRFKIDLERKGLSFTINNKLPGELTFISTDHQKLNIILNNLISNAIKFTNFGSIELCIQLRQDINSDNSCEENDPEATLPTNSIKTTSQIEFVVKDTGIGIAENKQLSIFERFIQVDDSNTRRFEGSGLGTTIAKAYVEALGGTIWVESDMGKGSLFHFTIPAPPEPKKMGVKL